MRRILYILIIFLSTSLGINAQVTDSTICLQEDERLYDRFFYEAEQSMLARKFDEAYDLYTHCLDLNPNSGVALYQLSLLNRMMRNDSIAISQMEKATELYPDNYWYKDMLVKLYFTNGRKDEACKVLEAMSVQFPKNSEVLMMLLDLYASNNDYPNTLKMLDKIEVKEGKSEQISMEKFRIYAQMKDMDSAFKEMESLAKEYPNDLRYQVLVGDLYLDQEKTAEAKKVYDEVARKDSTNVNLNLSLATYYQRQGNDDMYQKQLSKVIVNPSLDGDTRYQLMNAIMYENINNHKDSTILLNIFDDALALPQEDIRLTELYVRYLFALEMPKQSIIPSLEKMLEMEPEYDMARNQLLQYAMEDNNATEVIRLCTTAVEYNTANPVYYYYLAVGYYQQDSLQKAEPVIRKGLERAKAESNSNIDIITGLYGMLGDIYHQQGDDVRCFEAYDSCLIYRYDDAMVLNNYAYYLSLLKKDLKRAEDMSRRSNELEPDNATYLDTMAWILYQQKRYDEAKEVMDKVVKITPPEELKEDSDVLEHIKKINAKVKR